MLSELSLKRLKDLTEKMAISGDEVEVRRYLEESYKSYGGELIADNLGSIALVKKSKNPNAKTVLLLGHMDEVGFVVKSINDKGNLSLATIGGWWSQTLLGQRVLVKAKDGQKYKGTIGSIPPHLLTEADRAKPMEIKNMLVDIGCTSKDEVLALGINTGSAVILDGSFEVLNEKRLLAKAFDNRYGCAMGLEALSRGAKSCVFLDKATSSIIKENAKRVHVENQVEILRGDVKTELASLKGRQFDYIFMDPPYGKSLEKQTLEIIAETNLLEDEGVVIIEASKDTDFSYLEDWGYIITKRKEYKTNMHVFLRIEKGNEIC